MLGERETCEKNRKREKLTNKDRRNDGKEKKKE